MKKIIKGFKNPFVLLALLSLPFIWPVFLPGYFSHHDDLQVMRILEMRKCLSDFQIPCRWVPDMGYGNGFPLFNYYSALPYYVGAFLSLLFGYIGSAKLLFLIPLILGAFTSFLLARELFGKTGGLVAAVLYMYAPYRALDSYVRGAIAESFALSIAPLVFYSALMLFKRQSFKNFGLLSLSLGAFLTCHNIMTILFVPTLLVWVIGLVFFYGVKPLKFAAFSFLLGVGLAAFFIFPAFFEKNLVQTETLTRFDLDFRAHFVSVRQLFTDRFWGYGASVSGPGDGISFQIGWPHWWLAGLSFLVSAKMVFTKVKRWDLFLSLFFGALFLISIFMMHNKSSFVWEQLRLLQYSQFPWRFLSLTFFSASILGGWLIHRFRSSLQIYLALAVTILSVLLNFYFFKPDKFYFYLTDKEKLSGELWEEQQRAGIFDYLPKTAIESREKAPNEPLVVTGRAKIADFKNRSNWWKFNIVVEKTATIEMPVYDFPNWRVYVDGNIVGHSHDNLLGRIEFNLGPGNYEVRGRFQNTFVRTVSNAITAFSLISLVFLYYKSKRKNIYV